MRLFVFIFTIALFCPQAVTATDEVQADRPANLQGNDTAVRGVASFGQLPLYFIENRGQMDKEVAFYVKGSDKTLYFTSGGITFTLTGKKGEKADQWCVKLDFVGATPGARPVGREKQKAVFSYFKGKQEEWNTAIPTFAKLVYENLWPGIDLVYSGTVNQLKYEFRVKPGADPDLISLAYCGASEVLITESEALKVITPCGSFEDDTPYAYQVIDGKRKEVSMRYAPGERNSANKYSYGFDVGTYDPTKPLVLDPAVLVYCGYIGGDGPDEANGIAVDDSGNAYVVGTTWSTALTFPVMTGPDTSHNGMEDAYVAKINAQGTALIYCGYIGGSSSDTGKGIAVDAHGNAYVCGQAYSDESTFPVKVGPDLIFNGGLYNCDGYVAKINAQGTGLDYCGYIGGDGYTDNATGIAVDTQGNAYVVGTTKSDETSFPVKLGPDLTFNGVSDNYVAKVNAQGTDFVYCGYIGGAGGEPGASDIAVDGQGNAYITGKTGSDEMSFPVIVGPDLTHNGGTDAFITKVDASGAAFLYCGYIGGAGTEWTEAVAIDQDGNAYVSGWTNSDESSFPVVVGPDLTQNGDVDAFVAKINAQGTALDYCGFIGGTGRDDGRGGIAVDGQGNAYVTGVTKSDETSFPVTAGPDLTHNSPGINDAFVAKVNFQGTGLEYCGYIGGIADEGGQGTNSVRAGIAVDAHGCAFVAGGTSSDESTFPVKTGPDMTYNGNNGDGFIAKVQYIPPLTADPHTISALTGGTVNFTLDAGTWNADRNYLLLGGVTGTAPGTPLPGGYATLPLNMDVFTDIVLANLNGPLFTNFMGKLDADGHADASFNSPPLPSVAVGVKLYFAFCCNNPFNFVSIPVVIEIVT